MCCVNDVRFKTAANLPDSLTSVCATGNLSCVTCDLALKRWRKFGYQSECRLLVRISSVSFAVADLGCKPLDPCFEKMRLNRLSGAWGVTSIVWNRAYHLRSEG
jgi:hypothetical protein